MVPGMVWYGTWDGMVCYLGRYGMVWYGTWDGIVWYLGRYGMVWYGMVPGMVLAPAGGTGPRFPGAPVPPDGNVANPTRLGLLDYLSVARQPKKSV